MRVSSAPDPRPLIPKKSMLFEHIVDSTDTTFSRYSNSYHTGG